MKIYSYNLPFSFDTGNICYALLNVQRLISVTWLGQKVATNLVPQFGLMWLVIDF